MVSLQIGIAYSDTLQLGVWGRERGLEMQVEGMSWREVLHFPPGVCPVTFIYIEGSKVPRASKVAQQFKVQVTCGGPQRKMEGEKDSTDTKQITL